MQPTSFSGFCNEVDPDTLTCGELNPIGDDAQYQLAYVFASGIDSIGGMQFGVTYDSTVTVLSWTACGSDALEIPETGWPSTGTGNAITWGQPLVSSGTDSLTLVGAFLIAPGSTGLLSLTADPRTGDSTYLRGGSQTAFAPGCLGSAGVGGIRGGFRPCELFVEDMASIVDFDVSAITPSNHLPASADVDPVEDAILSTEPLVAPRTYTGGHEPGGRARSYTHQHFNSITANEEHHAYSVPLGGTPEDRAFVNSSIEPRNTPLVGPAGLETTNNEDLLVINSSTEGFHSGTYVDGGVSTDPWNGFIQATLPGPLTLWWFRSIDAKDPLDPLSPDTMVGSIRELPDQQLVVSGHYILDNVFFEPFMFRVTRTNLSPAWRLFRGDNAVLGARVLTSTYQEISGNVINLAESHLDASFRVFSVEPYDEELVWTFSSSRADASLDMVAGHLAQNPTDTSVLMVYGYTVESDPLPNRMAVVNMADVLPGSDPTIESYNLIDSSGEFLPQDIAYAENGDHAYVCGLFRGKPAVVKLKTDFPVGSSPVEWWWEYPDAALDDDGGFVSVKEHDGLVYATGSFREEGTGPADPHQMLSVCLSSSGFVRWYDALDAAGAGYDGAEAMSVSLYVPGSGSPNVYVAGDLLEDQGLNVLATPVVCEYPAGEDVVAVGDPLAAMEATWRATGGRELSVEFSAASDEARVIDVFDVAGRLARTASAPSGARRVTLDVGSGVFFVRMRRIEQPAQRAVVLR